MATIPAYNSATGAKTGKPSAEYDSYLKSLNKRPTAPKVPTTLGSGNINNSQKESTLPQAVTPTAGAGIAGAVEVSKNTYKDETTRLLAERAEQQKSRSADLKTVMGEVMNLNDEISNVGNTVDRTEEDRYRKQSDDLTAMIEEEQNALKNKLRILEKNPNGLFGGALTDEINRVSNESYQKQADLSVQQNIANRNYERANSIADRAVALKLEPLQAKLKNLQFFYTENKADFNTEDERIYSELIKKQDKELQKQEEFENVLKNVKMEIGKQGGSLQLLSKLNNITSLDELLKIPGISSYLSTEEEKYNLMKLKNDAFKDVPAEYAGEFGATIDQVANMEQSVYGKKAVAEQLKTAIANKDYTSAYAQIAQSVDNGLVGEAKQRFTNARTDYQVLSGLGNAVQAYADAGGDMGLLKGSYESIINKLGRVKDPKYKAMAVQLTREFQTYRNTMTGAAFSPQESAEYASVNPLGNKSLNLNLATIEGALAQLENRVQGTINARVPSAKYILEYATNPQLQGGTGTQEPQTNTNDPLGLFN